jgi:hypothetical protein
MEPTLHILRISPSATVTMGTPKHNDFDRREFDDQTGNATRTTAGREIVGNEESGEDDNACCERSDDEPGSSSSGDETSDCGSDDSWEGEPPPLELNYDALKHIADLFLPGSHGACVDITTSKRGTFHKLGFFTSKTAGVALAALLEDPRSSSLN